MLFGTKQNHAYSIAARVKTNCNKREIFEKGVLQVSEREANCIEQLDYRLSHSCGFNIALAESLLPSLEM